MMSLGGGKGEKVENLYSEMDYCMVGRKSGSFVALLLYCTISGSLLGGKSKVITFFLEISLVIVLRVLISIHLELKKVSTLDVLHGQHHFLSTIVA